MYATEYTWMSVPTKVTSRTNDIESVSTRVAKSIVRSPVEIQV